MCFAMPHPPVFKSIISFRVMEDAPMVAPRMFVNTHVPCTMGPSGFSLYFLPHRNRPPSPFMAFITTRRCGQTQRYDGGGRRAWDALSRTTCSLAPALRFLSPSRLMLGVWPYMSRPWCPLCRCLTHLGSHQVLLDTAMPSCPSQEDPGEASALGEAGVTGYYLICVTVYIHMWSM